MEFKIGQNVKINELTFKISAIANNYALVIDMSKGIVDGGYIPVIIKLTEDKSNFLVVTDVNEVKEALTQILSNGNFV